MVFQIVKSLAADHVAARLSRENKNFVCKCVAVCHNVSVLQALTVSKWRKF